ncbi:MAG: ABC transporter ATP-binding protein [Ignavibacteriaceae bacterium]|nr:ABC transporter ATP-binding protein [Ignavibacteriaceae bacterium]
MHEVILRVENLSKSFATTTGIDLKILKSISTEFVKGKITMIVGASGAGKSTFLHLLGGLDRPNDGKIFFKGENILDYSESQMTFFRNNNIGFVFQFHHLLPEFTAAENIAIPQMINGISLKNTSQRVMNLLEEVGLKDRKNHKPAELSGGEQQRIAVARALANNPQVILADEPTGNLDSVNSQIISNLIVQLNQKYGTTFIIATHNKELLNIADQVLEIKDGMINSK